MSPFGIPARRIMRARVDDRLPERLKNFLVRALISLLMCLTGVPWDTIVESISQVTYFLVSKAGPKS